MKKFILTFLIIIITLASALIFFVIPYGYHQAVHKVVIAENEHLKGKVTYEALTSDLHKSSFMLDNKKFKVVISTLTFFNPEDNHIRFEIINTKNINEVVQFNLFFIITSSGKLRFKVETEDLLKENKANSINLKGVKLFLGDFDIKNELMDRPEKLIRLALNKEIVLSIDESKIDIKGQSFLIKGTNLKLRNDSANNKLSFSFRGSSKEYNAVMNSVPLFYQNNNGEYTLEPFNEKKLITFLEQALDKNNPLAKSPKFMAMSALGIIEFPVKMELVSSADSKQGKVKFDAFLKMKDKNFLNIKNIEASIFHKNSAEITNSILLPAILTQFSKVEKRLYENQNDSVEQKQKISKLILTTLKEDLESKESEFMEYMVSNNYLTKDGELYILDLNLKDGNLMLNNESLEMNQLFSLPSKIIKGFYLNSDDPNIDAIKDLLESKGLKKNAPLLYK